MYIITHAIIYEKYVINTVIKPGKSSLGNEKPAIAKNMHGVGQEVVCESP